MKKIAVLMLIIILFGCSSFQLPSEKKEVIVDKLSSNTITVTFCGNAYMNQKEVEKYALQRACREALSKGCSHFMIVKKDDKSKFCSLSPKIKESYPSDNAMTVEDPGNFAPSEFVEPNITLTIQCVPKGEKIPQDAIDAEKFLRENFPGLQNK